MNSKNLSDLKNPVQNSDMSDQIGHVHNTARIPVYDEPFLVSMFCKLTNCQSRQTRIRTRYAYVLFAFDSRSMQVNLATMQITEQFQSQTSLQQ